MRISKLSIAKDLAELGAELHPAASLADLTSLGIGGATDRVVIRCSENFPEIIRLLDESGVPHRLLGGGTNLLVADGELPWIALQLPSAHPGVRIEGDSAIVDAAADLGGTVTFCAKNDLGGMEGLIGVPGTVGGALRMNAGAYGTQIGSRVREVELYRRATGRIESLRGNDIRFDYRHTSFAPEDVMLRVRLELPRMPYREIVARIQVCNQKRRASQPLNQKSAGCIFKNPPGLSAGRMIDELGLKGFSVGDAAVNERHANFFINRGHASFADMNALVDQVRERVRQAHGVELENEVIFWTN
jgi:UDP-N-acetylmuramate dehydrogenase